jgi:hypothetical protein
MENEDQEYEQHQGEDDYILGNDDVQEEYIITEGIVDIFNYGV